MVLDRKNNNPYFEGVEVEKTPFYGEESLFVMVYSDFVYDQLVTKAKNKCVYLGANQTLRGYDDKRLSKLIKLIQICIKHSLNFTVDVGSKKYLEPVFEAIGNYPSCFVLYSVDIPKIDPFIDRFGIKLDDNLFDKKNSGVWVMCPDQTHKTYWKEYEEDLEV